MKRWEYNVMTYHMVSKKGNLFSPIYYVASDIWERKKKDGKTTWDSIKELGKNGWEMISCVPLAEKMMENSGATEGFLFIFKRPLLEEDVKEEIVLKETTHEEFLKRTGGNLPPEG